MTDQDLFHALLKTTCIMLRGVTALPHKVYSCYTILAKIAPCKAPRAKDERKQILVHAEKSPKGTQAKGMGSK